MSKKVEKEQTKEQKRLAILLRTMVNGYSLEVNGEGGVDDQGGDQGYAELAEGWQCREETPGRGDRTESSSG